MSNQQQLVAVCSAAAPPHECPASATLKNKNGKPLCSAYVGTGSTGSNCRSWGLTGSPSVPGTGAWYSDRIKRGWCQDHETDPGCTCINRENMELFNTFQNYIPTFTNAACWWKPCSPSGARDHLQMYDEATYYLADCADNVCPLLQDAPTSDVSQEELDKYITCPLTASDDDEDDGNGDGDDGNGDGDDGGGKNGDGDNGDDDSPTWWQRNGTVVLIGGGVMLAGFVAAVLAATLIPMLPKKGGKPATAVSTTPAKESMLAAGST